MGERGARAGTKQNLRDIIQAIRVLKSIEQSGRTAGPGDKALMAKFTGFGAVARTAFPDPVTGEYKPGWEELGRELRELLTDEEYASAKATTFSAFYTSDVVMDAMYRGLARMGIGFGSKGLEPGCGVGGFIGSAPVGMDFIGVEQDSLSGRMAKLIYPGHDIRIEGFQDTPLPEGSVDFAIGNVPFADIKLRHRGERHSLHDFFFLKSLDAVRPGGALALVTSRYTLDKANPRVRNLLAEQADFVGAIRLPGDAFRDQGTEVVTDIIFLRKKLDEIDVGKPRASAIRGEEPKATTSDQVGAQPARRLSAINEAGAGGWKHTHSWLTAGKKELPGGEITINHYFQTHPEMVLGEVSVGHGMHNATSLRVRSDGELAASLHAAIDGLPENICPERTAPLASITSIEIDPDLPKGIREGEFFIADDRTIMQVTGGKANPVTFGRGKPLAADGTPAGKRMAGLIELKQRARRVLEVQQEGLPEAERNLAREKLQGSYTAFTRKFGPINKTTISVRKDGGLVRRTPNVIRFKSDPDVYLVMALEHYDERTGEATPAAIMTRDVVTAAKPVTEVDNAKDGLLASLNQLGCVDTPFIAELYGRDESAVLEELGELIFFDPMQGAYVPADEYLSGNVREKLKLAEISTDDPRVRGNVAALKKVQPEDLVAEEIDVTLGTPWVPAKDIEQFLVETLGLAGSKPGPALSRASSASPMAEASKPKPGQSKTVSVEYVNKEALWKVRPETGYRGIAAATSQFGTEDMDAFTLIEQALNMRTATVRRRVPGGPGESDTFVVDQEATLAAREKQSELKARFSEWVFADPARRDRLVKFYNEHFNNLRLREFDGSHLTFPRMNAAITMRPHQKDAIWRAMSSGNTLFAHVVGAGKTFTMVASGMEMKRTGLASKPLYVVPNHMLEQFSREFLILYPDANLLVAGKDDLRKDRRQLLKSRMATGEWDGIVMTHSSFEKIAMSPKYQAQFLGQQLEEYEEVLAQVTDRALTGNLTKKIEKLKAARKIKLAEMAKAETKDGGLFFDELGVDQVFVDEAHMFKNLETPTKMDRVAGIQTGGSNRAFDLFMKARFLQSRTPGRGLVFATGTPVSNSLGEMYTMMRYLMPECLKERGIEHFDAWAAAFGEIINALEISPDGQSLRVNTRFAKFKNLPELLILFRLFADVQTGTMLKLPVPEIKGGKPEIVAAPMTDEQGVVQDDIVRRYEAVRAGMVEPHEDNALKIVTDGRKLALDARLVDEHAVDDPGSKVNLLVDKVYEIWEQTSDERLTQMVFSDLGVNPTGWGFSVYDDVVSKLIERGIPAEEIASIGDAGTDQKKEALFGNVRSGKVRILLGSTVKMGTGTNVQAKLCALHHLDPPWRPADIEQREGRIVRQGNQNKEVEIFRYVTEGSFDAYMWQTLETKAKFIAQAMAGDAGTRRADDIGGAELSFAEVKAIASGNPAMMVLAEIEVEVRQLALLKQAHLREQSKIRTQLDILPRAIKRHETSVDALEEDIARRSDTRGDAFVMTVAGRTFQPEKGEKRTARQRAEAALTLAIGQAGVRHAASPMPWRETLGELGGLDVVLSAEDDPFIRGGSRFMLNLEGVSVYEVVRIDNPAKPVVSVLQLENILKGFDKQLAVHRAAAENLSADLARYQERDGAPFASEDLYQELVPIRRRLKALLSKQEERETTNEDSTSSSSALSTSQRKSKEALAGDIQEKPAHEEIRELVERFRDLQARAEERKPVVRQLEDDREDMPEAEEQHPEAGDHLVADADVGAHNPLPGVADAVVADVEVSADVQIVTNDEINAGVDSDRQDGNVVLHPGETRTVAVDGQEIAPVVPADLPDLRGNRFRIRIGDYEFQTRLGAEDGLTDAVTEAVQEAEAETWVQTLGEMGGLPVILRQSDAGLSVILEGSDDAIVIDDSHDCGWMVLEGLEDAYAALRDRQVPVTPPQEAGDEPASADVDSDIGDQSTREATEPTPAADKRRGQLTLFGAEPVEPAFPERKAEPGREPVQLGLFGSNPTLWSDDAARKPREPSAASRRKAKQRFAGDGREVEVRALESVAALEVRGTLPAEEPAVQYKDLDERDQRRVTEILLEFDTLWSDATWRDAIAAYEDRFCCEISDVLFDYLTADEPEPDLGAWGDIERDELYELEMQARGQDDVADPEEIERWHRRLSDGDIRDMEDYIENAPAPTEDEVVGRFTRLVGGRQDVGEIVHDAIGHFEPFDEVIERVRRETGRDPDPAAARGARSHYNAALARNCGWEAGR